MRCFIGLEIPENVKKEIHKAILPLRANSKGWEDPHDYHQTLCFIGECSNEELSLIKKRLDQIFFAPFVLETEEIKFLRRRIMYLDLKPSDKLLDLIQKIKKQFPEWIRSEEKEFLPHITLKRWQRYEYDKLLEESKKIHIPSMSIAINSLALFESCKNQFNQKYHVIYRSPVL